MNNHTEIVEEIKSPSFLSSSDYLDTSLARAVRMILVLSILFLSPLKRNLSAQSVASNSNTHKFDQLTKKPERKGPEAHKKQPAPQKLHSTFKAFGEAAHLGSALSVLALLIAYLTLRELRFDRLQGVKPLLILNVAHNGGSSYFFELRNEGPGVAFNVAMSLEEVHYSLGSLDFVPAGGKKGINVNLKGVAGLEDFPTTNVTLTYFDIYRTRFKLRFQVQTSTTGQDILLDTSSVRLREFSEKPRYARKVSVGLRT